MVRRCRHRPLRDKIRKSPASAARRAVFTELSDRRISGTPSLSLSRSLWRRIFQLSKVSQHAAVLSKFRMISTSHYFFAPLLLPAALAHPQNEIPTSKDETLLFQFDSLRGKKRCASLSL